MTLGALTVTVVKRGWDGATRDRHNNPVVSELGTFTLTGCNLQPRDTSELLEARDTIVNLWDLFTPPPPAGQTVAALDRIRIDASAAHVDPDTGQTYATFEVDGDPAFLDNLNGTTHHLELTLKRAQL